jgi:DNA-binding transcriptional regulator YdaS (Cro superfamily)
MRLADVLDLLRKRCADAGSLTAFAEAHGLNKQYVSQVLHGLRPPSARLCGALRIRYDGGRWIKS